MAATFDRLQEYRSKRRAGRTPEPFGAVAPAPAGRPARFVVQKHAARRLHYDFRLELGGVLVSWAVPKGPSLDPAEKRLAVATEDHPLDYAGFEGVIPAGNYGAGAVIVWDQGIWTPAGDAEAGLRAGKLLFDLRGYKLRGRWTLVRTRGTGKEWLLVKQADEWARANGGFVEESVLSGLAVEDLAAGTRRADEVRGELDRLGAPRRAVEASKLEPMLAESREAPFSSPEWTYELKYDGYRVIVSREDGEARLRFRGGRDATAVFPEVARAVAALPFVSLVMDGELVVLDEEGRPSFQRLQRRVHLTRAPDVDRASIELPATIYLFDLLAFAGTDVRPLPLVERKRLLERLLPRVGPLRFAAHVEERGEDLFREVERLGLEGIIGKKKDSPYR
ncbi:MAG: DNA polymerase ligase N-terminal domain-containing protein, partial [Candidatus Binatia bacterium]